MHVAFWRLIFVVEKFSPRLIFVAHDINENVLTTKTSRSTVVHEATTKLLVLPIDEDK